MTEVLIPNSTEHPKKVLRWDKTPDPVVAEAAAALQQQREKPLRPLDPHQPSYNEGVYILPSWAEHRPIKLGQRRGVIDLQPRDNSAHGVVFGVAELRTLGKGAPVAVTVAIKPFTRSENAVKDAASNTIVLGRGFRTTNPICVVVDQGRGYIISPARTDIMPLGTEPWHQFLTGSERVKRHFRGRLQQIGNLLADLNACGINHSDPQIKNFWVNNTGNIEPIDWEAARIFDNPPKPIDLLTAAVDDLRVIFGSLTQQYPEFQIPILTGSPTAQWSNFKSIIFGPYSERLMNHLYTQMHLNGLSEDEILNVILEIEENLRLRINA